MNLPHAGRPARRPRSGSPVIASSKPTPAAEPTTGSGDVGNRLAAGQGSVDGRYRIFLCHSTSDKAAVRRLYDRLRRDGFDPWLDEEDLLPGQDWNREIRRAIRASRFVVVCLSRSSVSKTGYVQKEITAALDVAAEQPDRAIYLVPARLEPCDPPDRLADRHAADLYTPTGYDRLLTAIRQAPSS